MDALEKAVARARDEVPGEDEGAAGVDRSRALVGPLGLDDIRYSNTQVLDFDPASAAACRLVAHQDGGGAARLFSTLAMQLVLKMRRNGFGSLGIVAPTAGTGCSLLAANLALALAREPNQTVLAVDLDLRGPGLAQYYGFEPERGLADVLASDVPVADVLVNPGIRRLVLLPGRGSVENADELLASRRAERLMKELRERYESRLVLYDVPPLVGAPDALSVLPRLECALLVIQEGFTTKRDLDAAKRLLQGVPIVGAVVNKGRTAL